jgi:hypothetical protein
MEAGADHEDMLDRPAESKRPLCTLDCQATSKCAVVPRGDGLDEALTSSQEERHVRARKPSSTESAIMGEWTEGKCTQDSDFRTAKVKVSLPYWQKARKPPTCTDGPTSLSAHGATSLAALTLRTDRPASLPCAPHGPVSPDTCGSPAEFEAASRVATSTPKMPALTKEINQ